MCMENSLYSQFKKLYRSYYNIDINADLLFDATKGKTKCRDFIKEHFTKGCKDEVQVSFSVLPIAHKWTGHWIPVQHAHKKNTSPSFRSTWCA